MPESKLESWYRPEIHPQIEQTASHVWRIPLDRSDDITPHLTVLSPEERDRVSRFYYPHHGRRYAIAHAALRQLVAAYEGVDPRALDFAVGEHGKPALAEGGVIDPSQLHFNLSHSGDMALLAVSRHGAVGVDVERWRTNVHHLEIAERFFSPLECEALFSLSGTAPADHRSAAELPVGWSRDGTRSDAPREPSEAILRGFFSTWSRKEAYLKATGHGIARGLHHFDVTMEKSLSVTAESGLPQTSFNDARLVADRLDPQAPNRWVMRHLDVATGYSGALVTTRTDAGEEGAIALFESPYI